MKIRNLTWRRFGRLTVIQRAPNQILKSGRSVVCWEVMCDCGMVFTVEAQNLTSGKTLSCGCYNREKAVERGKTINLKHGQNHREKPTAEYRAWISMKSRCYNPNATSYKDYGGRGVRVCERWLNSFEAFFEDMGKKPAPDYSLDRIDPYGNYTPENCRWADKVTQSRNTRKRADGGYKNGRV